MLGAAYRAIPSDLPICAALPDLLAALAQQPNAVLVAPPGAGKTTSVPLALLDAPWLAGQKIIILAPRRLAARAAAARMAALLGEAVGQTVGYRVRLDTKVGPKTVIEVVTEGVFNRMILDDPELGGVGIVIFDEVHERNLEGDLARALALDVQNGLRADLRLLAMSATLDGARVSALLNGAPVLESAGRMFPVETIYTGHKSGVAIEIQAADAAVRALGQGAGDVLVFLPGLGEINRALTHLSAKNLGKVSIFALHGNLEPAEQDQALAPMPIGQRKIILATSIAETSLTIEGVRIVVDCGYSRVPVYEPDSGLTRLVTLRASRASADQRRGRAGRTAAGQCYRLWEEAQTGAFPAFDQPEIMAADLAPLALTLAKWGVNDPAKLAWLDRPPSPAWQEAIGLLTDMGALDKDGRLTPHGHILASFGLAPRLSHMIISAHERGFGVTGAYVAALLSEHGLGGRSVDLEHRLIHLRTDRSPKAQKAIAQARHWAKDLGAHEAVETHRAGLALALAFPERVAKARDGQGGFVLRNGRGGQIEAHEPLAGSPFLAVGALQGKAGQARIAEAASLSRDDIEALFGTALETKITTLVDQDTGHVRGRTQTRLGAIVLRESPIQLTPQQIGEALLQIVARDGLSCLNWSDKARQTRARLYKMHDHDSAFWPDISDAALLSSLHDWLAPALVGHTHLTSIDVGEALLSRLDWPMRQALNKHAPADFETPAGTTHPIDYTAPQGPSVAVRVQEMFGLSQHPCLGGSGQRLVFQLLSPAHRPIATTSDLPAFWAGAWGDARKEMKARYPKHVWPENPATAAPTTRAKPRGT